MSKLRAFRYPWLWGALLVLIAAYLMTPYRGYSAEDHVNVLIAHLKDSNPNVRYAAADALGSVIDAQAVGPLIAALKDPEANVRVRAADALGRIGPPAVDPLITALKDSESDVRSLAAEALGNTKDARAVDPLIAVLKDSDSSVRWHAADALGSIKDARAVDPLIAVLKDSDSRVRCWAADALGNIKDARAVDPLIAGLKDPVLHGVAAGALGGIGPPAVDALISCLKDSQSYVRGSAADALGSIEDPRAVAPLIAALKDRDSDVRGSAADALTRIGPPAVVPLIAMLKDSDSNVRRLAARDLGDIADEPAKAALWAASDKLPVVAGAYRFFIRAGKGGTQAALVKALNEFGDRRMAEDFTNCGQFELRSAGRQWAEKNGYQVLGSGGFKGPVWGEKR